MLRSGSQQSLQCFTLLQTAVQALLQVCRAVLPGPGAGVGDVEHHLHRSFHLLVHSAAQYLSLHSWVAGPEVLDELQTQPELQVRQEEGDGGGAGPVAHLDPTV